MDLTAVVPRLGLQEAIARSPGEREHPLEHQVLDIPPVGQGHALRQPVRTAVAIVPLGAWFGRWISEKINPTSFERFILVLLTISALLLIFT